MSNTTPIPAPPDPPLYLCALCDPHDGDRVYPPEEMWWQATDRRWCCRECWQEWPPHATADIDQAPRLDRWLAPAGSQETSRLQAEVDRLTTLLNTPLLDDFTAAVQREAAHQRERWGEAHDARKAPEDWFWTLSYLAGKALRAQLDEDRERALHHTVSSAALLLCWHRQILAGAGFPDGGSRPPGVD